MRSGLSGALQSSGRPMLPAFGQRRLCCAAATWLPTTPLASHPCPASNPMPCQVAGFRMHQAYRGQFAKLLHYIGE